MVIDMDPIKGIDISDRSVLSIRAEIAFGRQLLLYLAEFAGRGN